MSQTYYTIEKSLGRENDLSNLWQTQQKLANQPQKPQIYYTIDKILIRENNLSNLRQTQQAIAN